MTDELDQDLFEGTDDNEDQGSTSPLGDAAPPVSEDSGSEDPNSEKRVNDLMSKWQKAEGERKKLAARLAALEGSETATERPKPKAGRIPDEVQVWLDTAKDAAQDRIYQSDPRFAQYGIAREAISGSTPQEMRDAASRVKTMIDGIESRMRNRLMSEYGIQSEQNTAGGGGKPLDFASMSKEEFEKWVERGKSA